MRVLIAAVVCGLLEELRATLPSSEQEASGFVQGMAWMFAIMVVCLLLVTMAWAKAHGVAL